VFHVSFEQQNVQVGNENWLFPRRHRDRFEWIALLAYRRATLSHDGGWVGLDDIARLPRWSGKTRHHIGNNVARYLQDLRRAGVDVLETKSRWTGPYRLTESPTAVSFDVPLAQVERDLCIAPLRPEIQRDDLIRFVLRFVRAELLFQQGKLTQTSIGARSQNAYSALTGLVRDFPANPRLQLIALLAAVRVQFRDARFQAARETLIQYESLIWQVADTVLEAQYYLSLAWSYQRAESGTQSNSKVETALSKARECASRSGDRRCLGLLAYRTAWFLAKKAQYDDALSQMSLAVEAAVITWDFTALQAYCADLGSIMHRIGPRRYKEARRWILTGILLARWVRVGRDDAHGEMILGKMYCELATKRRTAELWLRRAERIAVSADNPVNLADIHMVWAFWHRQYGSRNDLIEMLGRALIEFRHLRNFDSRQKEKYMRRKFPSVWFQALAFAKSHAQEDH
jgi:hypothetical protein